MSCNRDVLNIGDTSSYVLIPEMGSKKCLPIKGFRGLQIQSMNRRGNTTLISVTICSSIFFICLHDFS